MGRKLFVGNLSFDVTNSDLEALFAESGGCESVAVITDRFSGQSRGFGFVEMASSSDAQRAIQQLDGKELKGRQIKVNEAREREDRGGGGGGGGRGGGGRGRY
jgi:RNA recognition motif-containing protein